MFVGNSFDGCIQEMNLTADDYNLLALVNRELRTYIENMEATRYVQPGEGWKNRTCIVQLHITGGTVFPCF